MTDNEPYEKKQFSVPSRDDLIQLIKDLDQELDHVALNLIKCDFNATESDIRKTFPEFNFIKVKNYNPGSFEVVFQMRIDAINFIRNHYDKKILSRRFFIKMGRQQKQAIQDWTGVGNMPRQFRGPVKPHHNQNKPGQPRTKRPEDQTTEQHTQENTTQEKPATKEQVKPQTKTEVKPEVKAQTKTQEKPKKEGKVIPKFENQYKKTDYRKPRQDGEKRTEGYVKREGEYKNYKKDDTQQQPKKEETQAPKKEETQAPKKEAETKPVYQKKQEKVEPKKQPVKEEPKEDDGWITVPNKNTKRR